MAIGLFGAVGIVVITQRLAHLVHEFTFRIGMEFGFVFHSSYDNIPISGIKLLNR